MSESEREMLERLMRHETWWEGTVRWRIVLSEVAVLLTLLGAMLAAWMAGS